MLSDYPLLDSHEIGKMYLLKLPRPIDSTNRSIFFDDVTLLPTLSPPVKIYANTLKIASGNPVNPGLPKAKSVTYTYSVFTIRLRSADPAIY